MNKYKLAKDWTYQDAGDLARAEIAAGRLAYGEKFRINTVNMMIIKLFNADIICRKSKNTVNYSPVFVHEDFQGKMQGMTGISTNCKINTYCQERVNSPDPCCICKYCFACTTLKAYAGTDRLTAHNSEVLNAGIVPDEWLPIFKGFGRDVRFEAFGDLSTVFQVVNYFHIAAINPAHNFTLWTKNAWIIADAFRLFPDLKKPDNLILIESSCMINNPGVKSYDFIDKVFHVMTAAYAEKHNIKFNCCGENPDEKRQCKNCRRCYDKTNTDPNVYELLRAAEDITSAIDSMTV